MLRFREWLRATIHNPSDDVRSGLLVVLFVVCVAGLVWGALQVKAWSDSINHIPR